jgi:magnesium-transporting ATPase (P-type)
LCGGVLMEAESKTLEQNKQETPLSFNAKVAVIGFYGGLIWSVLGYFTYLLNFTKYGPALVLSPWALGDWKTKTLGQFIGIIVIALISILVAFAYKFVLSQIKSIWAGILFGIVLWGIVFYILNPIFPNLENVTELGRNTLATSICIYILYGLFVGYSISFEYNESQSSKDEEK